MPGGVTHMTCILRVDIQLTRLNVWQANPAKSQIFQPPFFALIKPLSLHMMNHLLVVVYVPQASLMWLWIVARLMLFAVTNISAEACSWFVGVRSWSSTQTVVGKVTSMTPSGEQTAWASSPLQWWRSSADEQVDKQAPRTQHLHGLKDTL